MRVAVPHALGKDEVRRRLRARSHEIADFMPGGLAQVETGWAHEDRMTMTIRAMGQDMGASVEIEERQMVVEVTLPPALAFVEPMVAAAIRQKGVKLLK
jgi:hypothetical protein